MKIPRTGDFSFYNYHITMSSNRKHSKSSLIGMSLDDFTSIVKDYDEPKYRAEQLFTWIYKRNVQSFAEMENLTKQLKIDIANNYLLNPLKILKVTGTNQRRRANFY